ncbi:MAG: Rho termination factor [Mameliella sp.]|nr:Rho termination factor [Mameliella sp.]
MAKEKENNSSIKDEETYQALRDKGYAKSKAAAIANAQANDNMAPSRKGGKAPPYEEWTRDALYDRARELDVDGRSQMTKSELIDALRG